MESPGELGLAWVWEEEGSGAGCSQEEPQELSPCMTPFLPAVASLAIMGSEKGLADIRACFATRNCLML